MLLPSVKSEVTSLLSVKSNWLSTCYNKVPETYALPLIFNRKSKTATKKETKKLYKRIKKQ